MATTEAEKVVNNDAASDSDSDSGSSDEEVEVKPLSTPRLVLDKLVPEGEARLKASYDNTSNIFEQIELTLRFPDGNVHHVKVTTGETIFNIKKRINDEGWAKYDDISLYLNNQIMLDPLSLNDFPNLVKDKLPIEVKLK
eukprot:TRINITY_DN1822_c0_g1_i1.p1 TRINITY_DN1822_c0_g1~~TRINITY_DN1822_c0_g1_i1.p1  ORF type:complete len:140 (-),score=45.76 TRINITY_DN1822_c0_g1_i1:228-647(-)